MTKEKRILAIKEKIVSYPDFPKKGIIFRDFLPVLRCPKLFEDVVELFMEHLKQNSLEAQIVVGIDARGFPLGALLAHKLSLPFVPVRKQGKLPGAVVKEQYALEYGMDGIEIQADAIKHGSKVVIIDDLLATGGTMQATVKLVQRMDGIVQCCLVVIELKDLNGMNSVNAPVYSLIQY